jgi:Regulator of ribonuclease activity B
MEAGGESYEHVLKAHLDVNPRSWAALRERGVDEHTPLQLDFEYTAPGEVETRSLMRFLRTATDYEFKGGARTQADGTQRWLVLGTTSPMTLSLDALNDWVAQMTAHGRDHGPARFDGWGARTPKSAAAGTPGVSRTVGGVGGASAGASGSPEADEPPNAEPGPTAKPRSTAENGPTAEARPTAEPGPTADADPTAEATAPKGILARLLRGRRAR